MVEPETFMFLADVATKNRKAWMDTHREERDDALRNVAGIVTKLHGYARSFDPKVAEARIKPKQGYSKFFKNSMIVSGPAHTAPTQMCFSTQVTRPGASDIHFMSSLGPATRGLGFCSPRRVRMPDCVHVLSAIP